MNKSAFLLPVIMAAGSLLLTDTLMAQPNGGGRQWGRGWAGGTMGLLNSEQVQGELELVDDQLEELKSIQESAQQAMRDMFSEMQDIPREERRDFMMNMREKLQERMKEFEEEANLVLLPHQKDRLKQLSFQSLGRGRGAGGALSNDDLLEELGVSEDQRKELEEATAKAREELQEKYAEMVSEAENDILKVLTKEQREKYKELVGERFEFDNNRGRGNGGNRGERGRQRGEERERSDF